MAKPLTCAGMLLVANMLTLPAAIAQVLAAAEEAGASPRLQ